MRKLSQKIMWTPPAICLSGLFHGQAKLVKALQWIANCHGSLSKQVTSQEMLREVFYDHRNGHPANCAGILQQVQFCCDPFLLQKKTCYVSREIGSIIRGGFHREVDLLHMKLREILHNRQFYAGGTVLRVFYDLCFIADKAGGNTKQGYESKQNRCGNCGIKPECLSRFISTMQAW